MPIQDRRSLIVCFFAFAVVSASPNAPAQEKDAVHVVSGVVKHVDRGSRKLVIKASNGVEHTIKWTGRTSWEGTNDARKGLKEGSSLTVRYTENAGEKTAVGIKDIVKDSKKALP